MPVVPAAVSRPPRRCRRVPAPPDNRSVTASARIEELRKKFEENPRRYFAPLANEYRKAGEIDQAISICREYLPQQPGHMSGHIVYGQALYEARQFEESKSVFETALTLDPENLIALRHLGDIALIIGDNEAARGWYRRVLEADPRNEEIQAQLARIDQGVAPAAASPVADPGAAPKPTPSSAPTVVIEAMKATEQASEPAASSAAPALPIETSAHADAAVGAPPPERIELDSPVPGAGPVAAPAVEEFRLDGLETTSLATPPQTMSTTPTLELDQPVANAVPTPPAAPPAAPALLDLELTTTAPSPPEPAARAEPPKFAAAAEPVPDLLDLTIPGSESAPEPAAPPVPESGPFVTETMAELYLKQGHREEALKVYRALLEQRPEDGALQAKVSELVGTSVEPRGPLPAGSPTHAPTIREVLALIATRRPGHRPGKTENGGAPSTSSPSSTSPNVSAAATDTLAAIFPAGRVSETDEAAARLLALAFGPNGSHSGDTGIPGSPARVASTELSLDTVFSATQPPAPPSTFSFDQFFSKTASAHGPGATQAGAESPDDVAKFTEWLQGLKQR